MTHDDGNSLIRYLQYGELFETEAIIVTNQLPDYTFDDPGPWEKAMDILAAYEADYQKLKKHCPKLPDPEHYRSVTHRGNGALPIIWLTDVGSFNGQIGNRQVRSKWGTIRYEDWIGEGTNPNGLPKDSEGSEFLVKVFERDDDRPIFVLAWGGPINFIQALYRFRERHGNKHFEMLMQRLYVYGILLQDITFDYLINLDEVRELTCSNMGTTRSTYEGTRAQPRALLHDAGHFWDFVWSQDPGWKKPLTADQVHGHGAMSEHYDNGGEGDSPAFLYLISASLGLNNPLDPTQGSWGSRFKPMGDPFPQGYFDTCDLPATELKRWHGVATTSFLNRLRRTIAEPGKVNREPVALLAGFPLSGVLTLSVSGGQRVTLDASDSVDPDGDELNFKWWLYAEAGTYPGKVVVDFEFPGIAYITIPDDLGEHNFHLILEISDSGTPSLTCYRRIIMDGSKSIRSIPTASSSDYINN